MFELNTRAIRSLMIERQLTVRDVAKAANITETTAARLSRDGARANARTTGKLAHALGVDAKLIVKEKET